MPIEEKRWGLSYGKRMLLAHTIQWMGCVGVVRMVQTAKVFGVALGLQS